jgi:hypothetical protein
MWGTFSDERTGLPFTMRNVQYIYVLHVTTLMYIQYIQGLCQPTGQLPSNGCPSIVERLCCGNVFTDPLPSIGHTRYNIFNNTTYNKYHFLIF